MIYKFYIYALYKEDEIIYIGRTFNPHQRLLGHRATYGNNIYLSILDICEDKELMWIEKMKGEGHNLLNNQTITEISSGHNIGDKIHIRKKVKYKVKDVEADIIYDSLYSLSKELGVDYNEVHFQLLTTKHKKPEYKKYILEYI